MTIYDIFTVAPAICRIHPSVDALSDLKKETIRMNEYLDVSIRSEIDCGLLVVESPLEMEDATVLNADHLPVDCPLLKIDTTPKTGLTRHFFDARALTHWTTENPALYYLKFGDEKIRFGHSSLNVIPNSRILRHNGSPCYLRGYIRGIVAHDHPNMTGGTLKDAAVKNIRQAKKYGFNLVRFHSTVPAMEFVETADEEGLLIHLEVGFTYEYDDNGDKKLSADNKKWEEVIKLYRNHPSIAIFCIGNEMHRAGHYPEVKSMYDKARSLAPGKLIMDNAGWGEFDRQTADVFAQHIAYFFPYGKHGDMFDSDEPYRVNGSVSDEPLDASSEYDGVECGIRLWAEPVKPVIAHEAIHYIDIPDYSELNRKYDEFASRVGAKYLMENGIKKPRYLTKLPELISKKGLDEVMPDYVTASRHFKMMGIKTYLEALRRSNLQGFEMLQLSDCLKYENKNGILDFFDDDKYIPPKWMKSINDDAVLLAEFDNLATYSDREVNVEISVSNYLREPEVTGELSIILNYPSGTEEIYHGNHISLTGGVRKLLDVKIKCDTRDIPAECELRVSFSADGLLLENSWKFWRYPQIEFETLPVFDLRKNGLREFIRSKSVGETDSRIVLTDVFDEKVFQYLEDGKTVVLFYHRDHDEKKQYYLPGALERFKPCIWDRGSNLGGIIYSDALRKRLGGGRYFDLNFHNLLEGGYKVCVDDFPFQVEEHVRGVDKPVRDRMKGLISNFKDFLPEDTLRKFTHLFSIAVDKGTLIVSTFNVDDTENPAVANFLSALLNDADAFKTDKSVSSTVLKAYLDSWQRKERMSEDVMNRFWEQDDKLVEDTLFWETCGIDLRQLENSH